jgi:FKBP-type peptidyl-prolyl cis-trans isomerase FklB
MQVGQSFLRDGLDIDPDAFARAVRDVLTGAQPLLSEAEVEEVLAERRRAVSDSRQTLIADKAEAEAAFLAAQAERPGMEALEGGVLYQVLEAGDGPRPAADGTVTVHYRGTLADGTVFDSSLQRGEPATFQLSRVIPGWREALTHMAEGSSWRIVIPSELAYGEEGVGGVIGPGEPLVFEVQLLEVH